MTTELELRIPALQEHAVKEFKETAWSYAKDGSLVILGATILPVWQALTRITKAYHPEKRTVRETHPANLQDSSSHPCPFVQFVTRPLHPRIVLAKPRIRPRLSTPDPSRVGVPEAEKFSRHEEEESGFRP